MLMLPIELLWQILSILLSVEIAAARVNYCRKKHDLVCRCLLFQIYLQKTLQVWCNFSLKFSLHSSKLGNSSMKSPEFVPLQIFIRLPEHNTKCW